MSNVATPKFIGDRVPLDRLGRLEMTVAEVLRLNYPEINAIDPGETWLDICEALCEMFAKGNRRFDKNAFFERCFGEDWGSFGAVRH